MCCAYALYTQRQLQFTVHGYVTSASCWPGEVHRIKKYWERAGKSEWEVDGWMDMKDKSARTATLQRSKAWCRECMVEPSFVGRYSAPSPVHTLWDRAQPRYNNLYLLCSRCHDFQFPQWTEMPFNSTLQVHNWCEPDGKSSVPQLDAVIYVLVQLPVRVGRLEGEASGYLDSVSKLSQSFHQPRGCRLLVRDWSESQMVSQRLNATLS